MVVEGGSTEDRERRRQHASTNLDHKAQRWEDFLRRPRFTSVPGANPREAHQKKIATRLRALFKNKKQIFSATLLHVTPPRSRGLTMEAVSSGVQIMNKVRQTAATFRQRVTCARTVLQNFVRPVGIPRVTDTLVYYLHPATILAPLTHGRCHDSLNNSARKATGASM